MGWSQVISHTVDLSNLIDQRRRSGCSSGHTRIANEWLALVWSTSIMRCEPESSARRGFGSWPVCVDISPNCLSSVHVDSIIQWIGSRVSPKKERSEEAGRDDPLGAGPRDPPAVRPASSPEEPLFVGYGIYQYPNVRCCGVYCPIEALRCYLAAAARIESCLDVCESDRAAGPANDVQLGSYLEKNGLTID